jgi:hypothetical protein
MRVPAWEGNWKARLAERLAARGFSTISALVDERPGASINVIAAELSQTFEVGGSRPARDLAPVQILWALLDEANASNTVEQRARDLFVRSVRDALPTGWPPARGETSPETRKPLGLALILWSGDIRSLPEYATTVNATADALLIDRSIPVGWLPSTVDDPLLLDLFRRHWREPSNEKHSTTDPR